MSPTNLFALRWLVAAAVLGSCSGDPPAPSAAPLPVVQALLVAGDSVQAVWIEWAMPADSALTEAERPVSPAEVELALSGPTGSAPLTPHPGVPTRFDVRLPIMAGAAYRLQGQVRGIPVDGSTRVPAALQIELPDDGATLPLATCDFRCSVPYRWSAAGAAAYIYELQLVDTSTSADVAGGSRGTVRGTTGALSLSVSGAGDRALTVLAISGEAADFLTLPTRRSNLTGAFGFLGGGTRAVRRLRWQ